jgi:hypothetical protein
MINQLTPTWALFERSQFMQLLKNFPAFYGAQMYITVFTWALHQTLSWARSILSIQPNPVSLRSILISTHTHTHTDFLVLLLVSFLVTFPPITYMHSTSPHSCYMSCLFHHPWVDHYTWWSVQVMKLIMQLSPTLCHFISPWSECSLQHPVLRHPTSLP